MKKSIFNIISTVGLLFVLFSTFVNAQKKKPTTKQTPVPKTTITKPPATVIPTSSTVSSTSSDYSLAQEEQAILDEINAVRNNPQKYISYLEEYRKNFKGNIVTIVGAVPMVTVEGVTAVDDAISFLKTVTKLPPYSASKGLTQSANLQLKDLMEDSSIGHKSKDGGNLTTRVDKFGLVGNIYAENITYGTKTPRNIVMLMILDDGVKSRSHRKNIFSPEFKIIGIGFGTGNKGESLSVTVFADSFKEKN